MSSPAETDPLICLLNKADRAYACGRSAAPSVDALQHRVASRRRVKAACVAATVCVGCLALASLPAWRPTEQPLVPNDLVELYAALERVEETLAEVETYEHSTNDSSFRLRSLVAAIELDRTEQRRADTERQLAELESTQPSFDEYMTATYENAALRFEIASMYQRHGELPLAISGYERLVASNAGTPWTEKASRQLALLRP